MKGRPMKTIRWIVLAAFATLILASESHAVLYWGRAYDPNLQRWIQRDPIGERDGIDRYQFVGNNPVNRFDPLGLNAYVINAGGGVGHTAFVIDVPGGNGAVMVYHFYAKAHSDEANGFIQLAALFYDKSHTWPEPVSDLQTFLNKMQSTYGGIYGDVSSEAMAFGTEADDASAIFEMDQIVETDDAGYYSLLGGRSCHQRSMQWFDNYASGGKQIPTPSIINFSTTDCERTAHSGSVPIDLVLSVGPARLSHTSLSKERVCQSGSP
jgi:RHS repeat-associated protein